MSNVAKLGPHPSTYKEDHTHVHVQEVQKLC